MSLTFAPMPYGQCTAREEEMFLTLRWHPSPGVVPPSHVSNTRREVRIVGGFSLCLAEVDLPTPIARSLREVEPL